MSSMSMTSKKSFAASFPGMENPINTEEDEDDQIIKVKTKGSRTVAFTGLKNVQEAADVKDDVRKMFVKFEEKTYTEQSLYKKDVDNSLKSMSISLNNFKVDFEAMKIIQEKLSQVKEVKKEENNDRICKVESDLISVKVKQSNLEKKVNDFIEKTDRTINDNLMLTGLVGDYNKFKDLRSLLEYLLSNTNAIQINKDKSLLEFTIIKEKMESKLASVLNKYDLLERSVKSQVYGRIEHSEDVLRNLISSLQDKLDSYKVESSNHMTELRESVSTNKLVQEMKSISELSFELQSHLNDINHKLHRLEQRIDSKNYALILNDQEQKLEEMSNSINMLNKRMQHNDNFQKTTIECGDEDQGHFQNFQISLLKSQFSETNHELCLLKEEIGAKFDSIFQILKGSNIIKDQLKSHTHTSSISNISEASKSQIFKSKLNFNNHCSKQMMATQPSSRFETVEGEPTIIYKMRQELSKDVMIGATKLTRQFMNPAVVENVKQKKLVGTRTAFIRPENKDISNFISFNLVSLKK